MNCRKPILIRGLSIHNLRDIDLDIPWGKLVVVTGPSGAGKSSLVFDAIYAESQRRFVETFSPYARQYLERLPRPAARSIDNLPAAVSIEQKNPVRNARSTVATLAELTWPARLLFFRLASLVCPECSNPVESQGPAHVAEHVEKLATQATGSRSVFLTVRVPGNRAAQMLHQGWFRCLRAGKVERLEPDDVKNLDSEPVEFVIDRFRLDRIRRARVMESAEQGFVLGDGAVHCVCDNGSRTTFSRDRHCSRCDRHFSPPSPALFSFNSSAGACPECTGFGRIQAVDPDLVVPDPGLSISQGAIRPFETRTRWKNRLMAWCRDQGIDPDAPWGTLSMRDREDIFRGQGAWRGVDAFFRKLEKKRYRPHIRMLIARYRTYLTCPTCKGGRFRPETLWYRLGGITLPEFYSLTVKQGLDWCGRVCDENSPDRASMALLHDLRHRLDILDRAGLSYLTMNRSSRTLSGGEAARINMARALGSRLTHTLYCVDEPSTGLHASDTMRIAAVLRGLVQDGNSVIAVDNDPALIRAADIVIELGPGSGSEGGQVVYQGGPDEACAKAETRTEARVHEHAALYGHSTSCENREPQNLVETAKEFSDGCIELSGVSEHNLSSVDVRFPAAGITCISGVSGSGKSTLAEDVLYRAVLRKLGLPCERPGTHAALSLPANITFALLVDQSPPSKTPRACPATALGMFDAIRKLFAATAEALAAGLGAGSFSFNTAGGRCEECKGKGSEVMEMQFLPDITLPCPHCRGTRFDSQVLQVRYMGRNIADVLNMTLTDAAGFFRDSLPILRRIQPAMELGLGHLGLGQPLNTLSAGEIQRLKLAEYLQKGAGGRAGLFILDEPTRGLHGSEVRLLMAALRRMASLGNTVVVVEHDLEVIASSHRVIDLGPGGGPEGGRVLYQGSPSGLEACRQSVTGSMLRQKQSAASGQACSVREAPTIRAYGHSDNGLETIKIIGARHHNLKNISIDIPHRKLVVITGVSGSGKSTLAFDCIFSEGQRRYVEGLSSYMRQFVAMYQRPDVDGISGLTPSVAIEQRTSRAGPMATVATMTETAHYLRLLYARVAVPLCIKCGIPMSSMTPREIADAVRKRWQGRRIMIAAPRIIRRKGMHRQEIEQGMRQATGLVFVDGEVYGMESGMPSLSRYSEHSVSWIMGRPLVPETGPDDILGTVEQALEAGRGAITVLTGTDGDKTAYSEHFFSITNACPRCSTGAQEPDPLLFSFNTPAGRCRKCSGRGTMASGSVCPACRGSRLNPVARSWQINSMGIDNVLGLEISDALQLMRQWLNHVPWPERMNDVALPLVKSICTRLEFLEEVGLGYLPLDLAGDCVSGGEAQRIRLAAQAGSGLSGVTVVLDEPTIGLHPVDNARLIAALKRLRDTGNSVIVVEHDEETLRCADWIIDLGPGGGSFGGEVVVQGSLDKLLASPSSATAQALCDTGRRTLRPGKPVKSDSPMVEIRRAEFRNLRGIDIRFPAGAMTVVTGVSGAGKSTLVSEVIEPALLQCLKSPGAKPFRCSEIRGVDMIRRVVTVDHSPIGKTPRSCPATYMGVWTEIRNMLARVPEARNRGYGPGRFSFNIKGGRCEACSGQGSIKVSLGYLPDVYVPCEQCGGDRFEPATLNIRWKGRSVAEILAMTINEARDFFRPVPRILRILAVACDLGLGYLTLGQPSPSLSGGEAQRLKLVRELVSSTDTPTLYLLDEPTTGLHIKDVALLVRHLHRLVDRGGTVIVIEHNLDVITAADWILDLGPGGGKYGGELLFAGTPKAFLKSDVKSATREALNKHLVDNA